MKRSSEAAKIVREIRSRLAKIPIVNTPFVRNVRREVSRQIRHQSPQVVMQTAMFLLNNETGPLQFVAYELISHHRQTFESLSVESLPQLGAGINSWSSVDCFAMYLSPGHCGSFPKSIPSKFEDLLPNTERLSPLVSSAKWKTS
jgi:hypothetical protein